MSRLPLVDHENFLEVFLYHGPQTKEVLPAGDSGVEALREEFAREDSIQEDVDWSSKDIITRGIILAVTKNKEICTSVGILYEIFRYF